MLCYPWGSEYIYAHRSLRLLAQRRAAAGIHTLRFDYFGTGDSDGDIPPEGMAELRRADRKWPLLATLLDTAEMYLKQHDRTIDSVASLSAYRVLTEGMCVPHVPTTTPSTRNCKRVARRARDSTRESMLDDTIAFST